MRVTLFTLFTLLHIPCKAPSLLSFRKKRCKSVKTVTIFGVAHSCLRGVPYLYKYIYIYKYIDINKPTGQHRSVRGRKSLHFLHFLHVFLKRASIGGGCSVLCKSVKDVKKVI